MGSSLLDQAFFEFQRGTNACPPARFCWALQDLHFCSFYVDFQEVGRFQLLALNRVRDRIHPDFNLLLQLKPRVAWGGLRVTSVPAEGD